MKREIKFNAWDGTRMLKNVGVHPHMIKSLVKIPNCKDQDLDCDYERGAEGSIIVCQKFDAYILLQFTGLKDQNGKEIYEGDIVQRGVITFSRGKFQGTYFDGNGSLAEDWEDVLYQEINIEILGNIYENPELLIDNL